MKYLKVFEGFDNYDIETIKDIFTDIVVDEYNIDQIDEKDERDYKGFGIFYKYNFKSNGNWWEEKFPEIKIWRSNTIVNDPKLEYRFSELRDIGLRNFKNRMSNFGYDVSYNNGNYSIFIRIKEK